MLTIQRPARVRRERHEALQDGESCPSDAGNCVSEGSRHTRSVRYKKEGLRGIIASAPMARLVAGRSRICGMISPRVCERRQQGHDVFATLGVPDQRCDLLRGEDRPERANVRSAVSKLGCVAAAPARSCSRRSRPQAPGNLATRFPTEIAV